MYDLKDEFEIFSDESWIPNEQFQSIWLISWFKSDLNQLEINIEYILESYWRKSIEFKFINWDHSRFKCAKEILEKSLDYMRNTDIKIDILTRDMNDKRHTVKDRDNIKNFVRMYYKVLVKCCERWGLCKFKFFPDQHSAINWNYDIKPYLRNTNHHKEFCEFTNLFDDDKKDLKRNLELVIEEQNSCDRWLIQLIDIITWLTRYTFQHWKKINKRMINSFWQLSLFEDLITLSNSEKSRFELFKFFLNKCKSMQWGISFNTNYYLTTYNSKWKLNFWKYEPQHNNDKVPIKVR